MKQVRSALGRGLLCFWIERRRVDPCPAIVHLYKIYLINNILAATNSIKYRLALGLLAAGEWTMSVCAKLVTLNARLP